MSKWEKLSGFSTRAIHSGYDPFENCGSLNPPVYLTSTFAFENSEQARETFAGQVTRFAYGRTANPTQSVLETRLANLEGAEASLVTASGVAAVASLMFTVLQSGDEVVAHIRMYGNTFTFLNEALRGLGIDVKFVDMLDPDQVKSLITERTKVVFFECPANPLLEVVDIRRISEIAKEKGALVVVDSTLASPFFLRPLRHGADVVVHSATKYISGHGDVLAGVISGTAQLVGQVRRKGLRYITGATLSPFAVHLILRGLKTLEIRMIRHSQTALALVSMLEQHPKVQAVYYPDLGRFNEIQPPRDQAGLGGGLVSFDVVGGGRAAANVMDGLAITRIGVSFGDAESLIQHPASMTHSAYSGLGLARAGLSNDTLRVSVGLEDSVDLIRDFHLALQCLA
jgi:methionine-gamma-lyase